MEKEIQKPLNLAIHETKQELRRVIANSKLPGYLLEPLLRELYNDCLMASQKELEMAQQEYIKAQTEAKTNKE